MGKHVTSAFLVAIILTLPASCTRDATPIDALSDGGRFGSQDGLTPAAAAGDTASLAGLQVFPADNAWNQDISDLPIHPDSDAFLSFIGRDKGLHPDFGTVWEGAPIGIPFVVVDADQPKGALPGLRPDRRRRLPARMGTAARAARPGGLARRVPAEAARGKRHRTKISRRPGAARSALDGGPRRSSPPPAARGGGRRAERRGRAPGPGAGAGRRRRALGGVCEGVARPLVDRARRGRVVRRRREKASSQMPQSALPASICG